MQDLVSAFHAIETRHVQVEDDDIWPEFLGLFERFAIVSGFATHLPSRMVQEESAHAAPDNFMIIGNEDTKSTHESTPRKTTM